MSDNGTGHPPETPGEHERPSVLARQVSALIRKADGAVDAEDLAHIWEAIADINESIEALVEFNTHLLPVLAALKR